MDKPRCAWAGTDPLYVAYHDDEWGVPEHDDRRLFEFLQFFRLLQNRLVRVDGVAPPFPEGMQIVAVINDLCPGIGADLVEIGGGDLRPVQEHIIDLAAVLAQPAPELAAVKAVNDFDPALLQ